MATHHPKLIASNQLVLNFVHRSEETAELLVEKSRIAEEESILLTRKASEAEQECQRAHLISAKTQEEKLMMEHKVRERKPVCVHGLVCSLSKLLLFPSLFCLSSFIFNFFMSFSFYGLIFLTLPFCIISFLHTLMSFYIVPFLCLHL